jgi:uncharacterized protein
LLFIFKSNDRNKNIPFARLAEGTFFPAGFPDCLFHRYFFFAFILSLFHGPGTADFFNNIREANILWFILYKFLIFLFVLGCVWLFQNLLTQKTLKEAGFDKKLRGKHFLLGTLAGLAVIVIIFLILWTSGFLFIENIHFRFDFLFYSAIITMLVSLIEEISMRGYLLSSLMDSMNKYLALLVSSMVFAFFHLLNPNMSLIGFTNIFLAGCLMGIGYIYNRSLWFPIALHFSWNFFLGPVFGFEVSGLPYKGVFQHTVTGPDWITGGNFGAEGSLLLSVFLIFFIVCFGLLFKKEKKIYVP